MDLAEVSTINEFVKSRESPGWGFCVIVNLL